MVFSRRRNRPEKLGKINTNEAEDVPEVILPNSKLQFCGEQLQNLNYTFTKNLGRELDAEFDKTILLATSVAERLIQRLVCGIGILDSRFCTKFLVALHDTKINNVTPNLEYIIRLDSLSQPPLYPTDEAPKYSITEGDAENCPPAYARIRLHPPCSKAWAEFINPAGYLRRDKVQAKVVELLALAASGNSPVSSLLVDESVSCGSPGKIVDAFTLYNILQKPTNQQLLYGDAGKNPRFPDPRDFKLAIVDKPGGIFVRIGFLSPALVAVTIEVRLMVAIALEAWPSTSNFPGRITLNHSDSVLYHRAAQTGMYLVGYGVHSSAWQIRLPAAEVFLENHYSGTSPISVILQTLCGVPRDIDEEYRRHQVVYRILNRYIMRSCMFYELEADCAGPTETLVNWSPANISTIVLKVLDKLISALRNQKQPNYFFPTSNLFVNPGHLCEDDFLLESNKIKAYMLKLFDVSLTSLSTDDDFKHFLAMQKTEMSLLRRFKDLVDGLIPVSVSGKTCCERLRGKRVDMHSEYTRRQVEYIEIALKNMLTVKHNILQSPDEVAWAAILKLSDNLKESAIEDIIYILATLVQQARDEYLETLPKNAKSAKNAPALRQKIDGATTGLTECMRKENDVADLELVDDATLVNVILKWLHVGLKHKKVLKKALQPYLARLYSTSHGASWHLETIKRDEATDEINSLCMFAMLVNSGTITPAQGLVDSVRKNWGWAKSMLSALEGGHLRLLFTPGRGRTTKHVLTLPQNNHKLSKSMHDLKVHNEFSALTKRQSYLSTLVLNSHSRQSLGTCGDYVPPHCMLRDASPMRLAFSKLHRNGEHRCCGDVLATLLAMQKVNVVREVSTLLPDEDRLEILEAVQKLQGDRSNRSFQKNRPNTRNVKKSNSNREKYTPKEESAGIRDDQTDPNLEMQQFASKRWDDGDKSSTLIGSCRAARIREDNSLAHFHDNFRKQSLLKHSSFKY